MTSKTPRRFFKTDEGDQIVMVGEYAYVWAQYYPPLQVGELVLTTTDGDVHEVTELGSTLGGARGFIRGRAGVTR